MASTSVPLPDVARPTASLHAEDREVWSLVQRDRRRHNETLNFIASENYASQAVLEALSCHLNVKYAEGYPRSRYYQGVGVVDEIEQLAIDRAKALFGAEHANVQPYSGSPANLAAYVGLGVQPGDTIMGMDLSHGGHLTHGSPVSITGKIYRVAQYHVRPDDERIDYDEVRRVALEHRPKVIVAGYSAYPRSVDWAAFRSVCDEAGAFLLADIAHIAGLVVGGVHPSPIPFADVTTTTTHKTLRGPRGALILCKEQHAKAIDRAVFPGLQGGPHLSAIASKAVAFREAMQPEFKQYAAQVVDNARALAAGLLRRGFRLWSGGTDNHLLVIELTDRDLTGAAFARALEAAGIIVSKSTIPGETRSPWQTSGVRLGTPALTSRGAGAEQMEQVATWIGEVADNLKDEAALERIRGRVRELALGLTPV